MGLEGGQGFAHVHADEQGAQHLPLGIPDGTVGGVVILAEQAGLAHIALPGQQLGMGRVLLAEQRAHGPLALLVLEGRADAQEVIALAGKNRRHGTRLAAEGIHLVEMSIQELPLVAEEGSIPRSIEPEGSGEVSGKQPVEAQGLLLQGVRTHLHHALDQGQVLGQAGPALLRQGLVHAAAEQDGHDRHDRQGG